MIYYDEHGNKCEFNKKKKIYKRIYLLSDMKTCLKTRINSMNADLDTLKIIRDMDMDGMYKLRDFLNDKDGKFSAYTMDYYESSPVDFLTMSSEYTIENYLRMEKIINRLIEEGIFISDLHDGNVIVNGRGITIIDADMYVKSRFILPDKIKERDMRALSNIFISLYYISLCDYHGKSYHLVCGKIEELFEDSKTVTKKLSRCRYPIDYFLKRN